MNHREDCGVCHRAPCQCPGTRLRRLLRALDDDIMEMSDEEIHEELRANGEDPDEVAARMRAKIEDLLAKHKAKP